MKKSLLTLAFAAIGSLGAFAQSYYYFKTTGAPAGYTYAPPASGVTNVIPAPANGVLSAAQNLPFPFTFFGINVSQYKVSTSGYITFDVSQTTCNSTNTALPSVTAPKLSIMAFWDTTKIEQVSGSTIAAGVKSWVTGATPNRVLHVQWQTAQSLVGTGINASFHTLLINENNTFDVIQEFGLGTFTGTIGVNNLDGTVGMMVDGSPNLNYGGNANSYDPAKSLVYNFRYGVQPALDLEVYGNLTPEIAGAASGGATIKVKTVNYGSTDITAAKMNYSVNGGAAVTAAATITVEKNAGRAVVSHPTAYVPSVSDANTTKTIKVWFSEINGGATLSDTLTFDIFNNKGVMGNKMVMVEEGSGAWCGYCPDGHSRLQTILEQNPGKVVAAVHHNSDGMVNANSTTINTLYATGYPYGMVDRVLYDDQAEVGMSRVAWAEKVTEQLAKPTPANISIINKNFDWAAGKVTYTVKVDFVDFAKPGDLRINTYIIEDKVRGPKLADQDMTWNQRNYYSFETGNQAGGSSHPLFTEPAYIVGYWHNEVVRNIPSGAWGTTGIITDPSENKSYTFDYTHTMSKATTVTYSNNTDEDTEYRSTKNGRGMNKFEDTKIIAFVSYYNTDETKRQILNATQTTMINTGTNEVAENNIGEVSVYPNPTNGASTVEFTLAKGSNVTIEVVNVLGQKVADIANNSYAAGSHSVNFDAGKFTTGIYFVNVTSEDGKATYRFVVNK